MLFVELENKWTELVCCCLAGSSTWAIGRTCLLFRRRSHRRRPSSSELDLDGHCLKKQRQFLAPNVGLRKTSESAKKQVKTLGVAPQNGGTQFFDACRTLV